MRIGNNTMTVEFESVGRLPHPNDNVAIATRSLELGTRITFRDAEFTINHRVLQGHRFAVRTIPQGEALLSWAQPFGLATTDIAPGAYVCNPTVLRELRRRGIEFSPPVTPNFTDQINPYVFDEAHFQPTPPLELYSTTQTFMGYRRAAKRGVG